MAKFTLTIETDDAAELHGITTRIALPQAAPVEVAAPVEEVATSDEGKSVRKRRTKAEMEAAATPAPVSIVDTPAKEEPAPAGPAAPVTPEIDPAVLKDLLVQLMDKKGAGYAQNVIRTAAPGKASLSQLAPEDRFPVYQAFQAELAALA